MGYGMSISVDVILSYLESRLTPKEFKDYCPNGLQIEGTQTIKKIITGVTASQALIDQAIAENADLLLVHHGFFWKGENSCITQTKKKRIKALLDHDINLVAYHLPLDAHPEVGNNAMLARKLGISVTGGLEPNNPRSVGNIGELEEPITAQAFAERIAYELNRAPLLIEGGSHLIRSVAFCTGGAQGYIEKAIALGADAYISGEVSEQTFHSAVENNIHYFAAGHHATERYGVQALGEELALKFDIEHQFIDINNPV